MAKEFKDKFFDELRNGVIDNRTELEKKRDMIKQSISELEENVIKDPKALENFKKELARVEKEIEQEETIKTVETVKEVEEKEEENKEDLSEYDNNKENADKLKQSYYAAMIALHEKKIQTINKQIASHELVSNNSDYEQEIKLESEMYRAREAYLKLGKEDPYKEQRTQHIKLEKDAREPIELELRNKAKRFREIEEEIKKIDKREQEINDELLSKDINENKINVLNQELEELSSKREKLEIERADIKDKLDYAIDTRRQRTLQRSGLEQQYVKTLSDEDKKNYNYQQSKIATMNRNFDQATKQHYQNIKARIEQREQKIKDINKELKEVPDTDFERRLLLLNELDKETSMLEADREAKADLDRGIIPDKQEMLQEVKAKTDAEEYRQEEFNKATDDVRAVVEEQKEKIGEAVVENPEEANMEEKDRDTTLAATTVAVVYDSPKPGPDTLLQDVEQYTITKCVIPGLEEKVRDPNNPEDAKSMVDYDDQLKEADKELDKVQHSIEQKVQK